MRAAGRFLGAPKTASQPNINVLLSLRSVLLAASHAPVSDNARGEVSRREITL